MIFYRSRLLTIKSVFFAFLLLSFTNFANAVQKYNTGSLIIDIICPMSDSGVGMGIGSKMTFSNDNASWSPEEQYLGVKDKWNLADFGGNSLQGEKIVYAKFSDALGNWLKTPVTLTVIYSLVPVASDSSVSTDEDTPKSGTLSAKDPAGKSLIYSIVQNASKGTVTINNTSTGSYTYTPNADEYGSDSFVFKASNGTYSSNNATVTITVNPINDPPDATDGTLNTDRNGSKDGTLIASDVENDALTFSIETNGLKGMAVITNALTGEYTYTPNLNKMGTDSFTFKVGDGNGAYDTATVMVGIENYRANLVTFKDGIWLADLNGDDIWEIGIDGRYQFGDINSIPLVGDWLGNGSSVMGIYHDGVWRLDLNQNQFLDDSSVDKSYVFGKVGDIPVVGDWDGDGITDIGICRDGVWMLDMNGNRAWDESIDKRVYFGKVGDIPVTGDWNGDGITDIGTYKDGAWMLDTNGNGIWDLGTDKEYAFGGMNYLPITGDWNKDGISEIGVSGKSARYLYMGKNIPHESYTFGELASIHLTGHWN